MALGVGLGNLVVHSPRIAQVDFSVKVTCHKKKINLGLGTVENFHRHVREMNDWWAHQDLNLEPTDYESAALTVELWAREAGSSISRAEASVRVRQISTDPEPWPLRTENRF
jgi:hypothetical protein